MLFNSLSYAVFLPVVLTAYYLAPRRWRIAVLLLASYWFYGSWSTGYLLLLVLATAVNYVLGLWLAPDAEGNRRPRAALLAAVGLNVSVLLYYKYLLFILTSVSGGLGWVGLDVGSPTVSILLPLGISFFVFEFVHYLIDVWGGRPPVRSPVKFAVFAAFFPTQIAGPIKRFEDFVPQLDDLPGFRGENLWNGLALVLRGLFKKLVFADNLGPLVALGFSGSGAALNPVDAWLVAIGFGMQIYLDFSGYTDIGRGSALMLGFEVPENFRSPYVARNLSDFWRRWHISLSTWMRDYVYIPLGGARRNRYRNLLITMVVAGAWHGANWTFVVWGAFHGLLLVGHWALRSRRAGERPPPTFVLAAAGWAGTFALVTVGWVFFRAPSLAEAGRVLASMAGLNGGAADVLGGHQRLLIVAVAAGCVLAQLWADRLHRAAPAGTPDTAVPVDRARVVAAVETARPVLCAAMVAIMLVFHHTESTQFIYFQF
ncbi:MAG TPA: MBOAT family protein [Acidimicrobiales bacterium]|nr:MBOAT family protein [Acidimicrobiales bacterium]